VVVVVSNILHQAGSLLTLVYFRALTLSVRMTGRAFSSWKTCATYHKRFSSRTSGGNWAGTG